MQDWRGGGWEGGGVGQRGSELSLTAHTFWCFGLGNSRGQKKLQKVRARRLRGAIGFLKLVLKKLECRRIKKKIGKSNSETESPHRPAKPNSWDCFAQSFILARPFGSQRWARVYIFVSVPLSEWPAQLAHICHRNPTEHRQKLRALRVRLGKLGGWK